MIKIGLDAGHGLYTSGKQTPDGIKEWTLNDKVRDKIIEILNEYDCQIINVDNNEGSVDEGLQSRLNCYINSGVAAFVSIHHNAFNNKWNSATGIEVYTDKNPTLADTVLANLICEKMAKYTALKNRGVKQANFTVINQNKIPAVLVEGGFMDSSKDYKIITSDKGQSEYARAVAESLIEFLNLKKNIIAGWHKTDKGWWYQNSDGSYPYNSWLKLDAWYYFAEKGYAVQSAWKKLKGKWYYFDKNCRMLTGVNTIGGKQYFLADDGHLCYTDKSGALK